ncbi:MAG: hypothetical protein R3185_04680 [Candidatus Thermoplasmatota archaeon]|nr:hypothetical protein [Candidatus Thermoplasmatota archaeon]
MEEAQAEGSDTSPSRSLSGTEDRTVAEMLWAFANALVILVALPATAYVLWNLFTTADFFDVASFATLLPWVGVPLLLALASEAYRRYGGHPAGR